jgi:hypothetical protein
MPSQLHACFISYRHPANPGNREDRMIQQVVKAFGDHLSVVTHEHEIYYDKKRLAPGFQYDERLAEAICRSACMVIVYWPSYLESEYCKQEIEAMLEVERLRREVLSGDLHGCRLFIPVILRGNLTDLHPNVTNGCNHLDYRQQALQPNTNLDEDPVMSEKLYETVEYIKFLCDKIKPHSEKLLDHCHCFNFPSSTTSPSTAMIQAAPQQPFPGRR